MLRSTLLALTLVAPLAASQSARISTTPCAVPPAPPLRIEGSGAGGAPPMPVAGRSREGVGLQLGTTVCDLQHYGSSWKMLAASADGVLHFTYTDGPAGQRRVVAGCVEGETITGPLAIIDGQTAHASMDVTGAAPGNGLPPHSAVVSFHTGQPATPWFGWDYGGCTLAFQNTGHSDTPTAWPRLVVDSDDAIHMLASGVGEDGIFDGTVRYDRSEDGLAYPDGWVELTADSETPDFALAAVRGGPGVAAVHKRISAALPGDLALLTGMTSDLFVHEARGANGDLRAAIAEGEPTNLTRYHVAGSTTPFSLGAFAATGVDAIYDRQADPDLHVAWTAATVFVDTAVWSDPLDPDGGRHAEPYGTYTGGSSLWHVNATTGEYGRIGGRMTGPDENWTFPLPGFHRLAQDRPQLAVDPATGWLYAVWNAYFDEDRRGPWIDDQRLPNGEIFAACSADNGLSWSAPVNLTNTASPDCEPGDCLSETFASLAEEVVDGHLQVSYQLDTHAGVSAFDGYGDGSAVTENPWMLLRVPVADVPPPAAPGDGDGGIGFAHYRRPWHFQHMAHPAACEVRDKLHVYNETSVEQTLERVELIHDARDDFDADLQAGFDAFVGDPLAVGEFVTDPVCACDWDGRIPAWAVTLLQVRVRHLHLPAAEQAFRFTFGNGDVRVYRYGYHRRNYHESAVDLIDLDNLDAYSSRVLYERECGGTADAEETPSTFALGDAYPNPFNPSTTIPFTLEATARVRLEVFDLRGARIATLHDGLAEAGRHEASFDGAGLASGLYLARLSSGTGHVETAKLLLVK